MRNKPVLLLLIVVVIPVVLLLLLYTSLGPNAFTIAAQGGGDDWQTFNEVECCPGDWDTVILYAPATSYVTRTNVRVHSGSYSYLHYAEVVAGVPWAQAAITCETPTNNAIIDAWVLITNYLGVGYDMHYFPILSAYDFGGIGGGGVPQFSSVIDVALDNNRKIAYVHCHRCDPSVNLDLGHISLDTWHNIRLEYYLPGPAASNAWIRAELDGVEWVNETGLTTEAGGAYIQADAFGVGPKQYVPLWGSYRPQYYDDVVIWGCDEPMPTPTPTPPSGDCNQYGHAAVLNVDNDCEAVLRFNAVPNTVPRDARVERATLMLYGVALEAAETIYIAPLQTLWGEMTCDWCRRTVGEQWSLPGATAVPEDRYPNKVAEFTAALGWISVDIPPYLVEEWALTSAANPGLILFNEGLTGKFGIASSEWIEEDYGPYMVIYYVE